MDNNKIFFILSMLFGIWYFSDMFIGIFKTDHSDPFFNNVILKCVLIVGLLFVGKRIWNTYNNYNNNKKINLFF